MQKRQYRERCGKAARDKTGERMGDDTGLEFGGLT